MSGWRWSSISPARRKIIRSSRAPAFARLAGPDEARGKAAASVWFISSWLRRGGFTWLRFTPNRERRRFRRPIGTCSRDSRHKSRKQQREGDDYGCAHFEHWNQGPDQARHGAGAESQKKSGSG